MEPGPSLFFTGKDSSPIRSRTVREIASQSAAGGTGERAAMSGAGATRAIRRKMSLRSGAAEGPVTVGSGRSSRQPYGAVDGPRERMAGERMAKRKVALAHGRASRGIGRACAIELAKRGFDARRHGTHRDRARSLYEHSRRSRRRRSRPLPEASRRRPRRCRQPGGEASSRARPAERDWPAAIDGAVARFGRTRRAASTTAATSGPGHMDPLRGHAASISSSR